MIFFYTRNFCIEKCFIIHISFHIHRITIRMNVVFNYKCVTLSKKESFVSNEGLRDITLTGHNVQIKLD